MAKLIFSVFFGIISSVTNIVLTPINAIVVGLFPNLSGILTTFNNAILIFASSPIRLYQHGHQHYVAVDKHHKNHHVKM